MWNRTIIYLTRFQVKSIPWYTLWVCERRYPDVERQETQLFGDCGNPNWSEELWSPKGQAFLRHRQVCLPEKSILVRHLIDTMFHQSESGQGVGFIWRDLTQSLKIMGRLASACRYNDRLVACLVKLLQEVYINLFVKHYFDITKCKVLNYLQSCYCIKIYLILNVAMSFSFRAHLHEIRLFILPIQNLGGVSPIKLGSNRF